MSYSAGPFNSVHRVSVGSDLFSRERLELPRLPVLGFQSFRGGVGARAGSILDRGPALLTTSGRAAFLHALRAFDVGEGDRVLVPTYHCPTMVSPVVVSGAIPVFYSIEESGMPSIASLESMDMAGVKAMLAAHYFGLPLQLAPVRRFCDARNIVLIEDCAHAFFGDVDGRSVGSVGDLALGSLPKFFPVNEGGCLVGPSERLARVSLRDPPIASEMRSALDIVEIGARYRRFGALTPILSGVFALKNRVRGQSRAERTVSSPEDSADVISSDPLLDDSVSGRRMTRTAEQVLLHVDRHSIVEARRRNYALLSEISAALVGARPLSRHLPEGAVPYVFPLLVDEPESYYQLVRAAGVPVFRWDRLWPGTPEVSGDCGVRWSRHVFQIGCHQDLSEEDIHSIGLTLQRVISRRPG